MPSKLAALALTGLCLGAAPAAAQICPPPILPAPTVPQFRAELPGVSLWPLDALGRVILRPASAIDEDRNSTAYNTWCIPGVIYGLELFQDLAAVDGEDDWLFVAYNAGVQVWDLRTDPADPSLFVARDGWQGQIEIFPDWGEGDTYIDAIDAVRTPDGEAFYLATAGEIGHGLAFWRFDPEGGTLAQIFQDSNRSFRDVELVERGGRVYAFAADPSASLGGIVVFDVSAADEAPCFDDTWPTICPQLLGRVGTIPDVPYVDTLELGGALYVVTSDGSPKPTDPLGVTIWRVGDPAQPAAFPVGSSVQIFDGLETNHRGVQLVEVGGRALLATVFFDTDPTPSLSTLRIYDVSSCLPAGCVSLGPPVWSTTLPRIDGNFQFLTASESGERSFLYYGLETTPLNGPRVEQLLDITGLGPRGDGRVFEVTEAGGNYIDPVTGASIDYWGDYYGNNTYGLDNLLPRHGIFVGDYFYRAAVGVLDVHRYQAPADLLIDGFESGDCRAWSASTSCF